MAACISQIRISAGSVAVTFCPPVAVNRTASPAEREPASSSVTVPRGTNRWRNGASGSSTVSPVRVQRGVPVLDADGGHPVVLGHAGRDRDQAAAQQFVVDLKLLVAGGYAVLVGHDPHLHEMHRVIVR